MMHLAYFVRPGDINEELRFSLRSAEANLPDVETIWIIGHTPPWLTGVEAIEGNRFPDKQRAVYDNVRIIAEHPDMPDEVTVMNDDFITLQPAKPQPAWRCTLADHIGPLKQQWWRQSLEATQTWLHEQGHLEPLSYELHRPMPIVRAGMAHALNAAADVQPDNPVQWRTVYGNLCGIGGEQDTDAKVYGRTGMPAADTVWLSTTDRGWQRSCCLKSYLAGMFHKPSRWEQ